MRPSLSLSLSCRVLLNNSSSLYTKHMPTSNYISILCSRRLRISFALFLFHFVLRFWAKKANVLLETGWSVARLPSREMSRLLCILIWWTVFSLLSMSNRPGNLILGILRYYWSEASQELSYKSLIGTVEISREKWLHDRTVTLVYNKKHIRKRQKPAKFSSFYLYKMLSQATKMSDFYLLFKRPCTRNYYQFISLSVTLLKKKNRYLAITVSIWKY